MKRNRFTFGIGTIGRDMVYTMISMYLIYYLTDVLNLKTSTLWWITGIILVCRIFDALNDPVMGLIVDNTNTRYGKFKPYIAVGALLSGIVTILIFTDFSLSESSYIVVFGILYLLFGITYTINDISYWSMLPSLSIDQKEREKIGSVSRICASIGLFFVAAGLLPLTDLMADKTGSLQKAFFYFALLTVLVMWAGQCVTLFGVKEPHIVSEAGSHTPFKELLKTIIKNDQLFYIAISLALFLVGYMTTVSISACMYSYFLFHL